jgi:AcrR family transcriptional regulator
VFQRHVEPISDNDTRVIAMFRLAWKIMKTPQSRPRIWKLVIQMLGQALANLQSDSCLVALTPWLPVLASQADPSLPIPEFREAFTRLLNLQTVPWTLRRDAIERLLIYLGSCPARKVLKLFSELEIILAYGIPGQDEEQAADLLPVLTAALERLPGTPKGRPLGSWLRFEGYESEQIRLLCIASAEERTRRLKDELTSEIPPRRAQALSYLLLHQEPEQIPALVDSWPAGLWRDDLCRRLAGYGWVTGSTALNLLQRIEMPA